MKDNHKRNRLHQKNLTIYELANCVDIVIYCVYGCLSQSKNISTSVKPSFILSIFESMSDELFRSAWSSNTAL